MASPRFSLRMKDNDKKDQATNNPFDLVDATKGFTKAEVNFLQYPIGSLDKKFKGQKIVFVDSIPVGGQTIKIEWEVTGNSKYGLPGPTATELDNVITKLVQEPSRRVAGHIPKWIKATYYELAKELGWKPNGTTYKRIKSDLYKLGTFTIVSRNAFKNKKGVFSDPGSILQKYQTIIFKGDTAPNWIPKAERNKNGSANCVYILLGDIYWQSLKDHYTKQINYDFMMSLGHPTLERIYQLLSLGFQTRMKKDNDGITCLNYNYPEFCGRLPIKKWVMASRAKEKLKEPLQKIVDSGYLTAFKFEFQGDPERWFIRFYPGAKAVVELEVLQGKKFLFNTLQSKGKISQDKNSEITYEYYEEDGYKYARKVRTPVVREECRNPYSVTPQVESLFERLQAIRNLHAKLSMLLHGQIGKEIC